MQQMEMKFAWVPPGTLARGSNVVTISTGFFMGITPVTQEQFKAVMGFNPSHFSGEANLPVEMVNWFDAQDFCAKLSELTAKPIRLPTEAEWEYACRAGGMAYHGGNDDTALKHVGWFYANSNEKTHPVGQLRPNAFGLFDMHGNVWEWCQDWFADYPKASEADPKGPEKGTSRVMRGGCCTQYTDQCAAAVRRAVVPVERTIQELVAARSKYAQQHYSFRVCFSTELAANK